MKDAFYYFDWTVAPGYEWREWLDDRGTPIVLPKKGLASLESANAVELLWERSRKADRVYGPVLKPNIKDGAEPRRYHPMHREYSALFREFADLDYQDKDSILLFAKRFGALGIPTKSQSVRVRAADGELHDQHAYGEPYLDWALEICRMREGLRLSGRKRSFDASRRFFLRQTPTLPTSIRFFESHFPSLL